MNNQRIKSRTLFGFEDLENGFHVQGIGSQTIDGFRGEPDSVAFSQGCNSLRAAPIKCPVEDQGLHDTDASCRAERAAVTCSMAASAVAATAVRCPIFRRGRGSVLP